VRFGGAQREREGTARDLSAMLNKAYDEKTSRPALRRIIKAEE
jgi:hypothetical protein